MGIEDAGMVHFTVKPCGFLYACPTMSEYMLDNVGHYEGEKSKHKVK